MRQVAPQQDVRVLGVAVTRAQRVAQLHVAVNVLDAKVLKHAQALVHRIRIGPNTCQLSCTVVQRTIIASAPRNPRRLRLIVSASAWHGDCPVPMLSGHSVALRRRRRLRLWHWGAQCGGGDGRSGGVAISVGAVHRAVAQDGSLALLGDEVVVYVLGTHEALSLRCSSASS